MNVLARLYYRYKKILKVIKLFLIIAGPGIIVMVADNDAGGITTYTATGAKFKFHLIWFLILLGPVAYYVQEMTVRLGAVTKRGHAEAIFHAFGSFWGWFSLLDLVLLNWLTMITEFIGMTAALSIFGVPRLLTVIIASVMMGTMVIQGRYWTWEKAAMVFCVLNLIYIPAAFMINPPLHEVLRGYPGNCELQLLLCLADGSRVSCRCDGMKVAVSEPMRSRVEALCGRGNLRLLTASPNSASNGRRNGQ